MSLGLELLTNRMVKNLEYLTRNNTISDLWLQS
jgi:hypothetical protein